MPSTERLVVLVTPEEKAAIAARAKSAKVPMGEFLRRAAEAYTPGEDESLLNGLVSQVEKSTATADSALADALRFIAASNRRIAAMEAARGRKSSRKVA